jgi:uncharacterized protein
VSEVAEAKTAEAKIAEAKIAEARGCLATLGRVVVALSGGVDSSLLLALAVDELGADAVVAATIAGVVDVEQDLEAAATLAAALGVQHEVVRVNELGIEGFSANTPQRCYLCRRAMCASLSTLALERCAAVVDGANADDLSDYRPGMRAAAEAGVRHPLAEAGLTKAEIRAAARARGLSSWNRPASPCLASRFPYGERITVEGLRMVAAAESFLHSLGFDVARVRHEGRVARLEVPVGRIPELTSPEVREAVDSHLRDMGYAYVTVDLRGFRSGSLNEVLDDESRGRPKRPAAGAGGTSPG